MLTKIKPVWWLCIGLITIALAHMSIHCAEVGWIAYTPFLVYLRLNEGIKSRMIFILFLVVAWSLCIVKIVSPPMPLAMVFLFSIPISLFHLPAFLLHPERGQNLDNHIHVSDQILPMIYFFHWFQKQYKYSFF